MFKSLTLSPQSTAAENSPLPTPDTLNSPPKQSQPEQADVSQVSSTDAAPDHFDDLLQGPSAPSGGGTVLPSNMLDKESFHKVFVGVFNVASVLTHLQSLKVANDDGNGRAASDALYETILDIPALHFLLEPQGKWAGRIMCIGMFAVPMAINVQAELAARTATRGGSSSGGGGDSNGGVIIPDFDMSGKGDRP